MARSMGQKEADASRGRETGPGTARPGGSVSSREEEALWQGFLNVDDSAAFLGGWLGLTCQRLRTVTAGALFIRNEGGRLGIGATWRFEEDEREAVATLADEMLRRPEPVIRVHNADTMIGVPVVVEGTVQAVLVVLLSRIPQGGARATLRELHWALGWIDARLWRGRTAIGAEQRRTALIVLEMLAAADEHERLEGAALAVVNAVVDLTGFDRASIALVRRGRARIEAISGAANFKRKAAFVSEMEAAADEVMARGEPVALPAGDHARGIELANRALMERMGAGALITVPLSVRGKPVGALIVARSRGEREIVELDPAAVDQLRLAGATVAPVLWLKHRERRWISGRARSLAGRAVTAIFGRRPAISLAASVALLLAAGLWFAEGDFRVRADAALRGSEQRAAIALLDGYVRDAFVRAGDRVEEGQEVAILDTRDIELQLAQAQTRREQAAQRRRTALASGDRAAAVRAGAEAEEAQAEIDLLQTRLDRARVLAPVSGLVVSGDLSQRLGTPVTRGDILFEIATLDAYRVLIEVSEYDVGLIRPGQAGSLVLTGLSGEDIRFSVTGISSVAEAKDGENRFRVEGDVADPPQGLRPGMEGVAKIEIGRERLVWIWMRGTIDRLRMIVWRFTP